MTMIVEMIRGPVDGMMMTVANPPKVIYHSVPSSNRPECNYAEYKRVTNSKYIFSRQLTKKQLTAL